jgi:hypothetical protein
MKARMTSSGAQEEDWGSGNTTSTCLLQKKNWSVRVETVRETGLATVMEKPSGPRADRVLRTIERQVLSAHTVTTKLTA